MSRSNKPHYTPVPSTIGRRRVLLGATAAAAGSLALVGRPAVAAASPSSAGGPPWARRDHAHDGGVLGGERPLQLVQAHTIRTVGSPRVDVAAFGAVGDGVTDDTAALQAAMDSPARGGIVAFEPGRAYRISDTVVVDVAKVRGIEGNNARVVTREDIVCFAVRGSHTGSANPTNPSARRVTVPEMNPFVRDLRVHGDPLLRGVGLQVQGTFGLHITGCHLFDLRTGIEVRGTNRNMVIADNSIWHCLDYGIWWHRGDVHQTNVVANHISYCRKVLFIDRAGIYNLQVVGNTIESSSAPDVVENAVHATSDGGGFLEGFEFIGNSLEDHWSAADAAIRIDGGPAQQGKQIMVIGNDLGNSRSHDVAISDVAEVVISGNSLDDSEDVSIALSGRLTAVSVTGNIIRGEPGRGPMGALLVGDDSRATTVDGLVVSGNVADFMRRRPIVIRNAEVTSSRISDNVLHYEGDEGGYALDITEGISRLDGVHVSGNTLRGSGSGDGKAIGVAADDIGLLVAKDNLASGFGPDAYDLPSADPGAVIVADNLAS